MKVLVFGAGAIGTYVGGSLALYGQQVVFLERPDTARRIREHGLRLRLDNAERRVPEVHTTVSLSEALALGPFDAAFLAVKAYDTAEVARQLGEYAGSLPPVICLQNGVENEAVLAQSIGQSKVIPGTVTTAIGRRDAGDIAVEKLRGIGLGGDHPLIHSLIEVMNQAGLSTASYPNGLAMKWSKMLTNLLANASSAILDLTPAEIYSIPPLYRLEVAQLREGFDVMAAMKLPVVDLPGTPVKLLAAAMRLPPVVSRPLVARAVGGGRGGKMPSFHIDLYSGSRKSEVDYLNGAVVRSGLKHGIATPANRLLNETLLGLAAGRLEIDDYRCQPDRLLAEWRSGRTAS